MKHFFFLLKEKPYKYGTEYRQIVFRIKKNKPEYIWETTYQSWSFKWHQHQTLDVLLEEKEITQKDYDMSENDWRWPWYYVPNNKFVIYDLV